LNSLYHKEPSFKLPTLEIVAAKAQGLIVKKGDLIALFNRGETHVTFEGLVATGTYNNLFTGEREVLNKSVTLKPYALFLLKK